MSPELLNVDVRKNRASRPNRRPPSIDFLRRSKEITVEIESGICFNNDRELSVEKIDTTTSSRQAKSMIGKKEINKTPPWLAELRRKKTKSSEELDTTGIRNEEGANSPVNVTRNSEEKKSEGVSCDFSALASKHSRGAAKRRANKKPEIKPTLLELQKGAEKINNSIAELQRDMQILLEQIKQMQTHSSVEQ